MDTSEQAAVRAFVIRADAYVALTESLPTALSMAFVERLAGVLVGLYESALALPDLTPPSVEPEKSAVGTQRSANLRSELAQLFSGHAAYWSVFDPYDERDHEPVIGDLVDDMVSIYEDVQTGLAVYPRGGPEADDAIWDWRFGFRSHWGRHLTAAVRALHALISECRV